MPKRNKTLYAAKVMELPDHGQKLQTTVHPAYYVHLRACEGCRHALIEMLQSELGRLLALDAKKGIAKTTELVQ